MVSEFPAVAAVGFASAEIVRDVFPPNESEFAGLVVAIPTLPVLATRSFELLPIMKLMEPLGAMLLIRYRTAGSLTSACVGRGIS